MLGFCHCGNILASYDDDEYNAFDDDVDDQEDNDVGDDEDVTRLLPKRSRQ